MKDRIMAKWSFYTHCICNIAIKMIHSDLQFKHCKIANAFEQRKISLKNRGSSKNNISKHVVTLDITLAFFQLHFINKFASFSLVPLHGGVGKKCATLSRLIQKDEKKNKLKRA